MLGQDALTDVLAFRCHPHQMQSLVHQLRNCIRPHGVLVVANDLLHLFRVIHLFLFNPPFQLLSLDLFEGFDVLQNLGFLFLQDVQID